MNKLTHQEVNKWLEICFKPFLKKGYFVDINGVRYTATDRGYLDVRMYGSDDPYGALVAFLEGDGKKPLLHGDMTIVVERLSDLTAFRTKWVLLPEEYELETEDGDTSLSIDFLRIGDDCEQAE